MPEETTTQHAYVLPEPVLLAWTRSAQGAEEQAAEALSATRETATRVGQLETGLTNRFDKLEAALTPMLAEFATELVARREVRAATTAGRLEGRSSVEVVLTSKPAISLYTVFLTVLAGLAVRCSGLDPGIPPKAQEAPQTLVGDPNG